MVTGFQVYKNWITILIKSKEATNTFILEMLDYHLPSWNPIQEKSWLNWGYQGMGE